MQARKGWLVKQSFSNDFTHLLEDLYRKYGEEVFAIQGIANKHMDLAQFSRNFFGKSSNVADITVDGNANVKEKNIIQYNVENNKAIMKLNSIYLIYKYIKDIFSEGDAGIAVEKIINGELFINDLTNMSMPYCYAFDLRNLLMNGMNFFKGTMKINPPKRSESFYALIIQSTAYISNQIMGAVSYPDFFVVLDKFYRKEHGSDYAQKLKDKPSLLKSVQNQFQNFIYSMNFPFRSSGQSAFVNLSVMDKGFLKSLFNGYVFPDGTQADLDSSLELSKCFFEYYNSINCKEGMFTFPVMTLAISVDDNNEYIDPDFVDWAAEANCEKALANIFQDKPTSFSSCCRLKNDFSKISDLGYQNSFGVGGLSIGCYSDDTEVLTDNGWKLFKDLDKGIDKILTMNLKTKNLEYHIPHDYIEAPYDGIMHNYKHRSLDFLVTPNHNMIATSRKTGEMSLIKSEDLKTGYNLHRLGGLIDRPDLGTYELGGIKYNANMFFKLVGMYLGDGGTYHNPDAAKYRAYEISFIVSKEREIANIEDTLTKLNIKYGKNYVKTRKCYNIRFYSKPFWDLVVSLGKCTSKYIPREFLNIGGYNNLLSLLEGLLVTDGYDGTNGRWYYTSSARLNDDVQELLTILGIPFHGFKRERKPSWLERDQKYISSTCPSYEIKLLDNEREIYRYSKYRHEVEYSGNIYCVTVTNNNMFVRRNGTVMLSGNSHRVAGLNLPRIAILEEKDPDILDKDLDILNKILYSHRRVLIDRIEGGVLPLYTTGWISLKRQYSTIGIIGSYEYLKNKNLSIKNKKHREKLIKTLQKIENKMSGWQQFYNSERIGLYIDDSEKYIYKKDEMIKVLDVASNKTMDINAENFDPDIHLLWVED